MDINLQAFFGNLQSFAAEGTTFVYLLALCLGMVFGLMAIMDLIAKGKSGGGYGQEKGWGAIIFRLLIASCFVTLASKLDMIISTNGDSTPIKQALAYAQGTAGGGGAGALAFVWAAISTWVVFLGTAGFMRGFLLFDKASQGGQDSGDNAWRGLWHVIGGALCVNVFS
ncbi:hypothetical protein [Polaromonas sp.]|uniref:hypothetical protein n=1 Tax=Polaromonas sp. TaxID=1869339 RepID=UPI00352A1554